MNSFPISTSDLASLNAEITLTIGSLVVLVWGACAARTRSTGRMFAWVTLLTVLGALAGVVFGYRRRSSGALPRRSPVS